MKQTTRPLKLLSYMKRGFVYRRDELVPYSKSIDRELKQLLIACYLKKVGPGLYYYPKDSRFGMLPPDEKNLLTKFLNKSNFLVLSNNWYNSLGLGLTQLTTICRVYNNKRHESVELAGQKYEFQRPNNGFPAKTSSEFMLVDLVNNLTNLGEDEKKLQLKIQGKLYKFDETKLLRLASQYGKVATKKYFRKVLDEKIWSRTY